MSESLDRLVSALDGYGARPKAQQTGGWNALCPGHDDRNPSLAFKHTGTRTAMFCHAGCDTADVLAVIGLAMRDLYDEPRGGYLATYEYRNTSGSIGRTVHRTPAKKFPQTINDQAVFFYRLSEVLAAVAAGRQIHLVEGEEDVHALETLGAVATTAPMGAANFDKVDVGPLRGAVVIAVVDRDEAKPDGRPPAGQVWAEAVRTKLTGVARSVHFVEAKAGKDASDHIAAGYGLTDFVLLETASDSVWGTPIPVDEIDRIPLPDSAGREPAELWAFVDAVAESLQVPRDMVLMLVLSILSTASGGRWHARISPDWVEPLSLMTVTSMASGSRKSATVKAVATPLYEVERQLVERLGPEVAQQQTMRDLLAADAEQLKRKLGKGATDDQRAELVAAVMAVDEIDIPTMPRLLADDITPESLGGLMAEQGGRMGVISAEGGFFAILAGRYSSGKPNLDLVLKAHAGDPVRVDRTSRPPLHLAEPFLAIGVTVQPDILEGLAETRLFRGSGLLARFFYAVPENMLGRRKLDPDPIPATVSARYAEHVGAIARRAWDGDTRTELRLSDAARKLLWQFRDDLEPKLDPRGGEYAEVVDWASKLPGQLVRIAALLTLFDDVAATEIGESAMGHALGLAEYLTGQALTAFDTINGRNARAAQPRAVLAWIRRKHVETFTVREARRDLGGQQWAQDVDVLRDVLADLVDFGWMRLIPQPANRGAGRPSERYEVNPAVFVPPKQRSVNFVNAIGGSTNHAATGDRCPDCGVRTEHGHQSTCELGSAA